MKVRFYCDVPTFHTSGYNLWANTGSPSPTVPVGWKRVAFDVDMPPDVLREHDFKAPAEFKGEL